MPTSFSVLPYTSLKFIGQLAHQLFQIAILNIVCYQIDEVETKLQSDVDAILE